MLKKIITAVLFILLTNSLLAKPHVLSKQAKVYLLTCSPGTELYQAFGHSAILISDPVKHINLVYHYGTFDFSTPHFYLKFIRGRLNYMLSPEVYAFFIQEYTLDKRDVIKSELNLNYNQKDSLYKFLQWKSLPENKFYKYDFFYDNCATRVRDLLEKITDNSIVWSGEKYNLTFRQALEPYLKPSPWTRFGINLLLGLPADKKLNIRTAMFLPDYLDTNVTNAQIRQNGRLVPLVKSHSFLINSNFKIGNKPLFNPTLTFWGMFLIISVLSVWGVRKNKKLRALDTVLFSLLGVIGLALLFMWFGTDHSPTKWNLNIIWAFPFHLWFAFASRKPEIGKVAKVYSLVFAVINLLLVVTFPVFPQEFDSAMIPLFLIFAQRFLIVNIKSVNR